MDDESGPAFRFKRRKIAHPRKAQLQDIGISSEPTPQALSPSELTGNPESSNAILSSEVPGEDEEPIINLKDIIRQRKRPQDRVREAARKAAEKNKVDAIVQGDASKPSDQYSGKFVAQTGQVVAKDDEQM